MNKNYLLLKQTLFMVISHSYQTTQLVQSKKKILLWKC